MLKASWIGLRDLVKAKSFQTKVTTACSSDSMPYAEFTSVVNKAAEETLVEPRPHAPPWFKASRPLLMPLLARTKKAQAAHKLDPTEENYSIFSSARKKIKQAVWTAKLR